MSKLTTSVADLESLLVRLRGYDHPAVESIGRKLYSELYLQEENVGIIKTHDDLDVYFYRDSFDYAFFTRSEWQTSTIKDVIDKGRVERIRWIKEFIAGNVSPCQCWEIPVGKRGAKKRLYFSTAIGYVIWLNPRGDQKSWSFKTAYPADPARIWDYTR